MSTPTEWKKYTQSKPPEWKVWRSMIDRCTQPSNASYHKYHDMGITVCERWRLHSWGFDLFLMDMGPRPKGKFVVDRIDPTKGYCPENCRWLDEYTNATRMRHDNDIVDEAPEEGTEVCPF